MGIIYIYMAILTTSEMVISMTFELQLGHELRPSLIYLIFFEIGLVINFDLKLISFHETSKKADSEIGRRRRRRRERERENQATQILERREILLIRQYNTSTIYSRD